MDHAKHKPILFGPQDAWPTYPLLILAPCVKVAGDGVMELGLVAVPLPDCLGVQVQVTQWIEVVALQHSGPGGILAIDGIPVPEVQRHPGHTARLPPYIAVQSLRPPDVVAPEHLFDRRGRSGCDNPRDVPIRQPMWPRNPRQPIQYAAHEARRF